MNIWLDPFSDMRKTGFQAAMGQIAIGSGGLFGRGLGNGMQKQLYLPEPHNDFIFATWCEEMGLIGCARRHRGLRLSDLARSAHRALLARPHGMLLATGITAKLAIQTIMNLFVVTASCPSPARPCRSSATAAPRSCSSLRKWASCSMSRGICA